MALIEDEDHGAAELLRQLGIDTTRIRSAIVHLHQVGPQLEEMPGAQFTPAAKRAIELALTNARELGHPHPGTAHFLLGMIQVPDCAAGELLRQITTPEKVRAALATPDAKWAD